MATKTKAQLQAKFVSGYVPTEGDFDDLTDSYLNMSDADINALTEKSSPHNDDLILLEDIEEGFAKKKVKVSSLGGGGGSGESNTLQMHGSATGTSIVAAKNGTALQVKGLKSSTSKITLAISSEDIDIGVNLVSSDVGLGDVTNHEQLKRGDGDINSFPEKSSPVSADVIISEDSGASYAKKKVQIGNLPFLSEFPTISANKTSGYSTAASDHNAYHPLNGTFTITLTDVSTTGVAIAFQNIGTGTITFSASGTLLHSGTKLKNKWDSVICIHKGSGNWVAMGRLLT